MPGGAMERNNSAEKAEIYQTLAFMNRAFARIVAHLESFRRTGAITAKYTRLFQGFTQEVQAEINLEVMEGMDSIEMHDWARFGRVREKWEKYLRGSDEEPSKPKQSKKRSTKREQS
jgi:hypothetical protein